MANDPWSGLRAAGGFLKPKHPKVATPEQSADPYADLYGYVTPPGKDAGFLDQMKYINRTSPGAFMQLGAGLMAGNTAGGISHAAQALEAGSSEQRKLGLAVRRDNMTRQWLLGQGFDAATADAAMANPDILASLLKRAEGGSPQNKFAPVLMKRPDGSFYYASPNPETGQLDPYATAPGDVPVESWFQGRND